MIVQSHKFMSLIVNLSHWEVRTQESCQNLPAEFVWNIRFDI